jgi:hypothetical protein
LFIETESQALTPPPADMAQIVFLEPINAIQGSIPVGLYEVEGQRRKLLAVTGSRTKVALHFTPGRHLLMASHFGGTHYLEANVEAGRRYYVLLRFIYANGFQLRPLRTTATSDYSVLSKDFPSWVSTTRFVEKTREGDERFKRIDDAVAKGQADAWKAWLRKTDQERAELTLGPQDAVGQ